MVLGRQEEGRASGITNMAGRCLFVSPRCLVAPLGQFETSSSRRSGLLLCNMRAPRALLLAWLGAVAVSQSSSQTVAPTPSDAPAPLDVPAPTDTPTPTTYQESCHACAATQECSHAYQGEPGRFCGTWTNPETQLQQLCCCPVEKQCKITDSACRCGAMVPWYVGFLTILAIILIILVGVGACVYCCIRRIKKCMAPKPGTAGSAAVSPKRKTSGGDADSGWGWGLGDGDGDGGCDGGGGGDGD